MQVRASSTPWSRLTAVRPRLPLSAEVAAARAAGRLSRLARRGGGTTVPGKLLTYLDPTAVERLAARLPRGTALVSATNGKTTTTAMVAKILEGRVRLAHNASGANLLSGVASTLISARDRELGLFERDEAALPDVARTPSVSAISFATSSTGTASSSSSPSAGEALSAISILRRGSS